MAQLSCEAADGKSDPDQVLESIFESFKDRKVKRKPIDGFNRPDDEKLYFWKNGFAVDNGYTLRYLLKNSDGRCNAWAEFLWACVKLNNGSGSRTNVIPEGHTGLDNGILVLDPTIINPGGTGPHPDYPYLWETDIDFGTSIDAQYDAPPSTQAFNDHRVYRNGVTIYDPSYGVKETHAVFYEANAFWGYPMQPGRAVPFGWPRVSYLRENTLVVQDCIWDDIQ